MKRNGPHAHDRLRHSGAGSEEPVVRITGAAVPLSDDVAARTRRYLVQMAIRVVCFLGAVAIDHWTRWLLLLGAVVLPYVAVLLANAGRERSTEPTTYLLPPTLPPGPGDARGAVGEDGDHDDPR